MDFAGKRKIWFLLSLLIIVPGLISLMFQGLNFGIDFTGGNLYQLSFERETTIEQVREGLELSNLGDSLVQPSDNNVFIIKTKELDQQEENNLLANLAEHTGPFETVQSDLVGPSIGKELRVAGITSLIIAIALMVVYISIRFEFKFAIAAMVAIVHDVLITVGIFSIFQIEVESVFVAAILTIIGYSINDTIVIFDRIRENMNKAKKETIETIVNASLMQTMARSINTVLTVLFVLIALYFFGGETIKAFALALIIGVTSGAYSSIFTASPVWLELRKLGNNKKFNANI